ncbi:MAG: recombinase family protein [Bacteroidetes bacterium]|nr:MAG: recombinase family protein [Bacteroidota bacterium]
MKKRVGIWIRVSTEDQAQGDSPEHHEHRARSYAEVKNWNIIEVYHLEAVSGKSVINHPEAKRMLEDIKNGHITGLIFSKLARLARNTRELLEFADLFQKYNADLTSLDESIDTSSPAGRFFYTLIAAMAEWERAEISSRVKASVPVRAKLGKSLGGEAPFGYKWEDKTLVLNEGEAPVRKLIHELFAKHKRKRTVATMLNEQGYRTRRGGKFSDTSIHRMLRDPIAKGLRRVNYTESTGEGKKWRLKPEEEWVFIEAPRIITDELWDICNKILDDMAKSNKKVRRKGIYLFSGIAQCDCGAKMYMRTKSPKYICKNCKNKISPDDLEEIFHSQLENFLFSDTELQNHLSYEKQLLNDKEELLRTRTNELQRIKQKIANVLELYHEGEISKEAFKEHHNPLFEKQKQIEQSTTELQGQIDALKTQSLDNSQVLHDAQNLHKQWHNFSKEDKKAIIEIITESIIIGKEDIEINLSYIPTLVPEDYKTTNCKIEAPTILLNSTTMQRTLRDSLRQ